MNRNIITGLNDARLARIKDLFALLKAELSFLIQLTAEERSAENAVAEGRLAFILESGKIVQQHGEEIAMPLAERQRMNQILFDFNAMGEIEALVASLAEGIGDTKMRIGGNAFDLSLIVKGFVNLAIRRGVPGMEAPLNTLNYLWEGRSRKNGANASTEETAPTES